MQNSFGHNGSIIYAGQIKESSNKYLFSIHDGIEYENYEDFVDALTVGAPDDCNAGTRMKQGLFRAGMKQAVFNLVQNKYNAYMVYCAKLKNGKHIVLAMIPSVTDIEIYDITELSLEHIKNLMGDNEDINSLNHFIIRKTDIDNNITNSSNKLIFNSSLNDTPGMNWVFLQGYVEPDKNERYSISSLIQSSGRSITKDDEKKGGHDSYLPKIPRPLLNKMYNKAEEDFIVEDVWLDLDDIRVQVDMSVAAILKSALMYGSSSGHRVAIDSEEIRKELALEVNHNKDTIGFGTQRHGEGFFKASPKAKGGYCSISMSALDNGNSHTKRFSQGAMHLLTSSAFLNAGNCNLENYAIYPIEEEEVVKKIHPILWEDKKECKEKLDQFLKANIKKKNTYKSVQSMNFEIDIYKIKTIQQRVGENSDYVNVLVNQETMMSAFIKYYRSTWCMESRLANEIKNKVAQKFIKEGHSKTLEQKFSPYFIKNEFDEFIFSYQDSVVTADIVLYDAQTGKKLRKVNMYDDKGRIRTIRVIAKYRESNLFCSDLHERYWQKQGYSIKEVDPENGEYDLSFERPHILVKDKKTKDVDKKYQSIDQIKNEDGKWPRQNAYPKKHVKYHTDDGKNAVLVSIEEIPVAAKAGTGKVENLAFNNPKNDSDAEEDDKKDDRYRSLGSEEPFFIYNATHNSLKYNRDNEKIKYFLLSGKQNDLSASPLGRWNSILNKMDETLRLRCSHAYDKISNANENTSDIVLDVEKNYDSDFTHYYLNKLMEYDINLTFEKLKDILNNQ